IYPTLLNGWRREITEETKHGLVLSEADQIPSLVDEARLCDLSVITGLGIPLLVSLQPQRIVLSLPCAAGKARTFVSLSSKETGFQVWLMNHEFGAVMPCWFTYTEDDRSQLILSGWDGHTVCPVEQNLGDYSITASEIVEGQSAMRPAT
ncbi:hypothetical protein Gogos_010016, partial [Gossypium gossypioides]|nr:hypothetical protein [Gossypium gossypioides]